MNIQPLILAVLLFTLCGCTNMSVTDKPLVTSVERLNSPDNTHTLYRYYVSSSMAFGSGSVRLAILNATDSLDYATTDFFTVDNNAPIVLGWKNSNTVKLIALSTGDATREEPYERKVKQWKGFSIEIDYYHMYSSGTNPYQFDSYKVLGDTITFYGKELDKSFIMGKVEMSYTDSAFSIREITTAVDSIGKYGMVGKVLVSSNNWELTPTRAMDLSQLVSKGVLLKKKL